MSNKVKTRHPEYLHREYEWRQLRDSESGTSNIKRSGELYLPIPSAMLVNDSASITSDSGSTNSGVQQKSLIGSAPWHHQIPAYSAYLQRARFPDIVSACLRGFVGIALKKDPEIELPVSLAYLEKNIDGNGTDITTLFKKIVFELLLMGKYTLLADLDENSKFKIVSYNAESFTNWFIARRQSVNVIEELDMAVFEEKIKNDDDIFSHELESQYRVLMIDPEGQYISRIYEDGKFDAANDIVISYKGKTLPFIPVHTANSKGVSFEILSSPMLGISDIAISVYQKDADLSQSEFLTCNPMLVVTGADPDDVPKSVGSSIAWVLPDGDSKAYYVEASGASLGHVTNRIKELFAEAVSYGANLLGDTKRIQESTETARMRQEGSGATLKDVVDSAEELLNRTLKTIAFIAGENPEKANFNASKVFSALKLTAQEQDSLLKSWMNNGISQETYLRNLKDADIIASDRTIEEEMADIEKRKDEPDLVVG